MWYHQCEPLTLRDASALGNCALPHTGILRIGKLQLA